MTDKRLKEILSSMTILIDKREHEGKHDHILAYFNSAGIKYKYQSLKFGDYSFELPMVTELNNLPNDSFENSIVIERKAHLTEISGNLCNSKNPDGTTEDKRDRFERELQKSVDAKAKFILMIEDNNGWQNILDHKYDTDLNPAAFVASLYAFRERYGIHIDFVTKKIAGFHIYNTFRYHLRKYLKDLKVLA